MSLRSNLGSVAIATLIFIGALSAVTATVVPLQASLSTGPANRWLDSVKAPHRQLFDAPQPDGGVPLLSVYNYYETYNAAYGVKDANVDAVLTFYGGTTFYAVNDAAWAKYRIGEFLNLKDAAGEFVTANPWRANPTIVGMSMPQASLESLKKRGAQLIACNNALGLLSGMLAAKRGLDAKTVHEDLKAHLLPEVELVPAMVIAIEQAHRAGLSYKRQ